jgi:excisionase family DNA binding protein
LVAIAARRILGNFQVSVNMNGILTRQEVSEFFKISPRSLDYWVATNQIPYSRLGKRTVRFSRERLEEWFREREGIEYHTSKGDSESDAATI